MIGKHSLDSCKSGDDFLRYARQHGADVETGGKHVHVVYEGQKLSVPTHGNEDLAPGTRHSIIKWIVGVGLAVFTFVILKQVGGG